MASWVFWLLLVVIVLLAAVILIRDKGVRGAITKFFSRIKEKIRVARIKSKINKENEKKIALLRNLGEETWRKQVDAGFISEEKNKVDKLSAEKKTVDGEIEKLNAEIEKNKKSFEEFEKKQESVIKEQEEKREPLEKELSLVKKELHDWQKEMNEKEKAQAKIEKKIASLRQKTAENEKDADLSNIEKQQNREEIEKEIAELENSRAQALQELDSYVKELPGKEKRPGEIEPRVREFDEKIKTVKEEKKAEEKRVEELTAGLRTNRNQLLVKQNQLKQELDALFTGIGGKINKNRVENSDLAPLYTQIDNLDKAIRNLEKQVSPEQQPPADQK